MTGLVGADTEELRALAADFRSGADELRELTAQLARGIDAAHEWQGQDASRCKDEWAAFAAGQLTGVSSALETAGQLLEANAVEQDRASGETKHTGGLGWALLDLAADLFPFGKIAHDVFSLWGKGALIADFLKALSMPAVGFAALSRWEAVQKAMTAFNTKMTGGMGRFFLPLTIATGVSDVLTGHGYSGLREWGSRGFGAVGAASATVLLGGALGLVSAPALLTAAGIGATFYSAWSLGNFVYDHRQQMGDFVSRAVSWTWQPDGWARTQVDAISERVGGALDWARRQLAPAPAPAGAGA